ncbi:MAG: hypothetical protein OEW45_08595 [Deltaproteobacteria bacterium]|jgi:hypothetical protein|nr:hypothetical protein [Deltaproteobacteria bacterium]
MDLQLTKHIIAAKNILAGTPYFLILSLPEGWKITRSYLQPDIHTSIQKGYVTWVEAGQTDQIVFHPLKRVAFDLMIQIKRGKRDGLQDKGVQVSSQGTTMVCGHAASYCIGEVKQGLFKKKTVKTLRLSFFCPDLNRTLILHFTGQANDADLLEIYESISFLECH